MKFPDGTLGWLVTSHAAVREALLDPRLSARQEIRNLPPGQERPGPAAPGFFVRMDPPDHTRYRRMLAGQFTQRRMNLLTPRIEAIVDERIDAMLRHGPPVDLVRAFALPIPSLVICELLGVPYADRERFQLSSHMAVDLEATPDQVAAAMSDFTTFLGELVEHKLADPGDDLVRWLIAASDLTDQELTAMAFLLLVAGHETTANMLGLGVFTLLCHPEQLDRMRTEPSIAASAVDELLRYLTIMQFGAMRVALEDVEFRGRPMRAGEALILSLPAANRDPEYVTDPDTLDLGRPASGHVAFGLGVHHCLGHQLARIEMRVAYTALLRRIPGLRLAVGPEKVGLRDSMAVYGVHRLPIAW
ncbi:cytochrome P450 [Nocardiopsis rhodophaea]